MATITMRQIVERVTGKPVTEEEIDHSTERFTDDFFLTGETFINRRTGKTEQIQVRAIDILQDIIDKELKEAGISNDTRVHGKLSGSMTAFAQLSYIWGQREWNKGATKKWLRFASSASERQSARMRG